MVRHSTLIFRFVEVCHCCDAPYLWVVKHLFNKIAHPLHPLPSPFLYPLIARIQIKCINLFQHLEFEIIHKPTFTNQLLAISKEQILHILEKIEVLRNDPKPHGN